MSIHETIRKKRLAVHFQPIVSLSRKAVVGMEGLIRGTAPDTDRLIAPNILFAEAKREGVLVEFDRLCRDTVLKSFVEISRKKPDMLLFINLDTSILDSVAGSNYFLEQVQYADLRPESIVIEFNEGKSSNMEALIRFRDIYRSHGFLIAADDVGTGFSNMDRISALRPDIIKIDISLVKNIHRDHFKQSIFRSLVNLSGQIGALVIAEGVEKEEEAIQIQRLGGQMFQGYYFAKPMDARYLDKDSTAVVIESLNAAYKRYAKKDIREERKRNQTIRRIMNAFVEAIRSVPAEHFDGTLSELIGAYAGIECVYLLDAKGTQVSNTIRNANHTSLKENRMIHAAKMNADHSMEKYCYPLVNARRTRYQTEPYVSLASGNLCTTMSVVFSHHSRGRYILCVDFAANVFPGADLPHDA